MDNITIRKEYYNLKTKNLGKPFNVSKDTDGFSENYKYKLFRRKEHDPTDAYLTIIINDSRSGFTISGSIRKWWFSKKAICRDFNLQTFCDCIETLAVKLQVTIDDFWYCKVTKLEIGGTIKLPRKFENLVSNMVSYPRLKSTNYANETKKFVGNNYNVIVYDKGKEASDTKTVDEKVMSKINEVFYIVRFEIQLKKPSGTALRGRMNSLENIKENWDFLIEYWEETFHKIEIIPIQSPKLLLEKYSRRELKNFLCVFVASKFGLDFIFNNINSFKTYRKRSAEKRHFKELCCLYKSEENLHVQKNVLDAVKRKAILMK